MSFKLLIASIERTIEMEKVKTQEREMMLASSKTLLYPAGEKLPVLNSPEFMAELNAILPLLRYLNEPLPEWCEVKEGSIDVPDELMPLFNKLGFQLRFHTISGVDETLALCRMLHHSQKFFHQYRPQP